MSLITLGTLRTVLEFIGASVEYLERGEQAGLPTYVITVQAPGSGGTGLSRVTVADNGDPQSISDEDFEKGIIVLTGPITAPRTISAPEITDDDDSVSRIIRNDCEFAVTIDYAGQPDFEDVTIGAGLSALLTFETDGVRPGVTGG